MNFELQLRDGTWVEADELPESPVGYIQAILLESTSEVMRFIPTFTTHSELVWAAVPSKEK